MRDTMPKQRCLGLENQHSWVNGWIGVDPEVGSAKAAHIDEAEEIGTRCAGHWIGNGTERLELVS